MANIEGKDLTLLWDIDRLHLNGLSFGGRTDWLEGRIQFSLLNPIAVLVESEQKVFPWLATTALVCDGIESLSGFYGDGRHQMGSAPDKSPFCRFVDTFMHGDFNRQLPAADGKSWTYCQHLQKYFRSGLGHGFSIEWGGLWHSDDPNQQPGYLRPAKDGRGVAICPRTLIEDFKQGMKAYFTKLRNEGENSLLGQNFQDRFTAILSQRRKIR